MDDDEIEFLDEVRASKKAEDERLRRETEEGLKAFRQAQKGGPKGDEDEHDAIEIGEDWGVGRKRKRAKEKDIVKGVRRRVSGAEETGKTKGDEEEHAVPAGNENGKEETKVKESPVALAKPKLGGLVDYGSDDDDDE